MSAFLFEQSARGGEAAATGLQGACVEGTTPVRRGRGGRRQKVRARGVGTPPPRRHPTVRGGAGTGKGGAGGAAAAERRERGGGPCQAVTAGRRGGGAFEIDTARLGVGRE